MSYKYKAAYGQRKKSGKRAFFAGLFITISILGAIGGLLYWDMNKTKSEVVQGTSVTVAQEEDLIAQQHKAVDEPFFTLNLPQDWKEIDRTNTPNENSITWQATRKKADNRWLKIYIDVIPPDLAFNRMLPVVVSGNTMTYGQMSGNCKEFTATKEGALVEPTLSRWQGIDFLCDLPKWLQNNVGVGTEGTKDSIKIKGLTKGEHKYMFVYTDHNIQPDYTIFYEAITSFQAK